MSDHLPADTSPGPTVTIQGILDRITFLNQESGYTVARLRELTAKPSGHSRNQITLVGFLSEAPVGSTLALTGNWQDDARYGRQFKVLNYTILKPNTINGIERYLGSGLIKGIDPAARRFKRNSDNPLRAEMVIIDEVSMLDITLANSLVKAVTPAASLLLVGDADQLPSVGPGNVLLDIIESSVVPVVHLNRIFRQGAGSLISVNAARVNKGEPLELLPEYKGAKDFYCIFREEQVEIEKEIISLCSGRLTAKYGFDPVRDIQVLSPCAKGWWAAIS